jgi:2-polyprenyl-3-methyl-5-hydroxy-6-metoxy-1,4-benzoquinol methylase
MLNSKKKYFDYKSYKIMLDIEKNNKQFFGLDSNYKWFADPRQFVISLVRYKFVSKILSGLKNVLEVGCADSFNSRVVKQEVATLDVCDNEIVFKNYYNEIKDKKWKINYFVHDFSKKKLNKIYDAVYLLDVLEHIPTKIEKKFIKNINSSVKKNGLMVVGIPSLEFQKYSRDKKSSGHINCKSGDQLKKLLLNFYHNVLIFSMNDEIVHTGFQKMACYLFAVCSNKK